MKTSFTGPGHDTEYVPEAVNVTTSDEELPSNAVQSVPFSAANEASPDGPCAPCGPAGPTGPVGPCAPGAPLQTYETCPLAT